jgi:hypothetical protein
MRDSGTLLESGSDPDRVHRRYLSAAFELADEAEIRALLAKAGDAAGLASLEAIVSALRELAAEVRAELEAQAEGAAS